MGALSSPFTDIFEYIGNVTLYLREQKVLISSFVPGSWAMKLLAGKPITTRPWPLYFSYSASRAVYWGVKPHLLATLTSKSTLPLYAASGAAWPSIELRVKS